MCAIASEYNPVRVASLALATRSLTVIPIPNSAIAFSPADLSAAARRVGYDAVQEAHSAQQAVARVLTDFSNTPRARVLICGGLYLAGEVLKENG